MFPDLTRGRQSNSQRQDGLSKSSTHRSHKRLIGLVPHHVVRVRNGSRRRRNNCGSIRISRGGSRNCSGDKRWRTRMSSIHKAPKILTNQKGFNLTFLRKVITLRKLDRNESRNIRNWKSWRRRCGSHGKKKDKRLDTR